MSFKEIKPEALTWNPFTEIGKTWFLVTAGDEEKANTMTVSWGGLGIFWGKPAATVYLRQTRYTKEFVDKDGLFTLSALPESQRRALSFCGSKSGRDLTDKIKEAGLTPYYVDGTTGIGEADALLVCKPMLATFLSPKDFIDPEMDKKWYSDRNYHTMYIAEITKVLVKE